MKIDNQPPLVRPGQTPQADQPHKVQGTNPPDRKEAGPAAMTHLRHEATDASQDIDSARVEEIREAIRDGRLTIRADRIADGLIASVRDLLGSDET